MIGSGSMEGGEKTIFIKDSNRDKIWSVDSIDVLVPLHALAAAEVRNVRCDLALFLPYVNSSNRVKQCKGLYFQGECRFREFMCMTQLLCALRHTGTSSSSCYAPAHPQPIRVHAHDTISMAWRKSFYKFLDVRAMLSVQP